MTMEKHGVSSREDLQRIELKQVRAKISASAKSLTEKTASESQEELAALRVREAQLVAVLAEQ